MPSRFMPKDMDTFTGKAWRDHEAVIYTSSVNAFGISWCYWQVPGTNEDDPCRTDLKSSPPAFSWEELQPVFMFHYGYA
jgi:hypothetical protein